MKKQSLNSFVLGVYSWCLQRSLNTILFYGYVVFRIIFYFGDPRTVKLVQTFDLSAVARRSFPISDIWRIWKPSFLFLSYSFNGNVVDLFPLIFIRRILEWSKNFLTNLFFNRLHKHETTRERHLRLCF